MGVMIRGGWGAPGRLFRVDDGAIMKGSSEAERQEGGAVGHVVLRWAAVAVTAAAVACSSGSDGVSFDAARDACAPTSDSASWGREQGWDVYDFDANVQVADDGSGVVLATHGEDHYAKAGNEVADDLTDVVCVLRELDAPETLFSRLDNTRALDGTQTAAWDGLNASWTYHPDSGLAVVVERDDG